MERSTRTKFLCAQLLLHCAQDMEHPFDETAIDDMFLTVAEEVGVHKHVTCDNVQRRMTS